MHDETRFRPENDDFRFEIEEVEHKEDSFLMSLLPLVILIVVASLFMWCLQNAMMYDLGANFHSAEKYVQETFDWSGISQYDILVCKRTEETYLVKGVKLSRGELTVKVAEDRDCLNGFFRDYKAIRFPDSYDLYDLIRRGDEEWPELRRQF